MTDDQLECLIKALDEIKTTMQKSLNDIEHQLEKLIDMAEQQVCV